MNAATHNNRMETTAARRPLSAVVGRSRVRLCAGVLALGGVLFVLYPVLRPFSDETSLQGAAAFASPAWLLAHMLAMVGFIFLALGLLGLYLALQDTASNGLAFWALVVGWLGTGLTLPFYGGEAFGLHAIGQAALDRQDASLVALAAVVRGGPELIMFIVGLLLLAAGTVLAAMAVWRSGRMARWSGAPLALGLVLFLPQFFGTQPLRIAHGALMAVGSLWLAAALWREAGR